MKERKKRRRESCLELWDVRFLSSQEHLFIGKFLKEWVKGPQNIPQD